MSSNIYDRHGRKIGELRPSGGLDLSGCLAILGIGVLAVAGLVYFIAIQINHVRYGADSPADATATAQTRTCYSLPIHPDPAAVSPSLMDFYNHQFYQTDSGTGGDYEMQQVQSIAIQPGSISFGYFDNGAGGAQCGMVACVSYLRVASDGSEPPTTRTDPFSLFYDLDRQAWVLATNADSTVTC